MVIILLHFFFLLLLKVSKQPSHSGYISLTNADLPLYGDVLVVHSDEFNHLLCRPPGLHSRQAIYLYILKVCAEFSVTLVVASRNLH